MTQRRLTPLRELTCTSRTPWWRGLTEELACVLWRLSQAAPSVGAGIQKLVVEKDMGMDQADEEGGDAVTNGPVFISLATTAAIAAALPRFQVCGCTHGQSTPCARLKHTCI